MKATYGRSPWIDQFPKSRIPAYPKYRGDTQAEVVIVGGGLTGCLAAYAFSAAGIKPVLLEADRWGRGVTGSAAGWIATEPGVQYSALERSLGRRLARGAWQSWRRGALDFVALLRRLEIKCALEMRGAAQVARNQDEGARLKREQKIRREAGVDMSAMNARVVRSDLAIDGVAAIRTSEGATVDPYRACVGIAAAAVERGALCFERSPVRRITFTRKIADVHLADGKIRTRRVVIATGVPTALFRALARHFWFRSTYFVQTDAVPARIRKQLGRREAVVRDLGDPPHVIRWIGEDRLLVAGADQPSQPSRQHDRILIQRTGQLMYELSTIYPDISGIQPEYGWSADYTLTAEGIPYIGPHRNYPHHLFVFGDSSHSVTGAYLASRVLLRQHLGESESSDAAFSFNR